MSCIDISIHTPVKGVTIIPVLSNAPKIISIHTPVKGVTPNGIVQETDGYLISIHTPVKGVTGRAWSLADFL